GVTSTDRIKLTLGFAIDGKGTIATDICVYPLVGYKIQCGSRSDNHIGSGAPRPQDNKSLGSAAYPLRKAPEAAGVQDVLGRSGYDCRKTLTGHRVLQPWFIQQHLRALFSGLPWLLRTQVHGRYEQLQRPRSQQHR